uniref:Uncharacterized protein n=1 Tax=Anguilla anguilla TaxID=7936 RepID=A0A0E9Q0Z1_ANGAN
MGLRLQSQSELTLKALSLTGYKGPCCAMALALSLSETKPTTTGLMGWR